MKKLEIDINEFLTLGGTPQTRAKWIESKLDGAGFDRKREIVALIDSPNMKYTYIQEDGKGDLR